MSTLIDNPWIDALVRGILVGLGAAVGVYLAIRNKLR